MIGRETIEHLADDTGLAPSEIDPEVPDDRVHTPEHLAKDTGLEPSEVDDTDVDPTDALSRAMPPD